MNADERDLPRVAAPSSRPHERPRGTPRWRVWAAALVPVLLVVQVQQMSTPMQLTLRRAGLRVIGEAAGLALAVHDPYAGQVGAAPRGLPETDFMTMTPRATGTFGDGAGGVVRVSVTGSAGVPVAPPFEFERWEDPGFAALRAIHPVESLVRRRRPDYPSLLATSAWVTSTLEHGSTMAAFASHFDAREILERTRRGEAFDCGTFAWTLIQVLGALGINARLVELEADNGAGHSVVEAWCDDLARWIVLDPYCGTTFEHHGMPLSALEL